jgi:hypothetical protein
MIDALAPFGASNDWTCPAGAAALKSKIETYWRERGYEVQVLLVDGPFSAALRATRVDVRSEMVNGLPRAALK